MKPRYFFLLILGIAVLYPFSYGPIMAAAELHRHYHHTRRIYELMTDVYRPLSAIPYSGPILDSYRFHCGSIIHPDFAIAHRVFIVDDAKS